MHLSLKSFLLFLFLIWLCHDSYKILAPRPGIEPTPSAVKVQSPNHWTAREVPKVFLLFLKSKC